MKLHELVNNLDVKILAGNLESRVEEITNDSGKCKPYSLFICLKGRHFDGHSYIKEAYEKGCRVFVVERELEENVNNLTNAVFLQVKSTSCAQSIIAANFYGNAAKSLISIGITGTKGKTTTAYMIKTLLDANGIKTGLIGTIETIIDEEHFQNINTTPDSIYIQQMLSHMRDSGCQAVVMEVSSQGVKDNRVYGLDFDVGVYTNLSKDHISPYEHSNLEEYIYYKAQFFKQCRTAVVNVDDTYYKRMVDGFCGKIISYGIDSEASVRAENIRLIKENELLGVSFDCYGINQFESPSDNRRFSSIRVDIGMPGRFSVYNSLAAMAAVRQLVSDTIHFDYSLDVLKNIKISGRTQIFIVNNIFTVIIDYAHNGLALKNILLTLREYNPQRIICVFGCGGNRDRERRYDMGAVSGKYSDITVVTTDNPRYEEVDNIIADIVMGIESQRGRYIIYRDRRAAIEYAMRLAAFDDFVVIAGKGHEKYQEIEGRRLHFDDSEVVRKMIDKYKQEN